MARCLIRRLLLLSAVCLIIGLSGCGGGSLSRDRVKPKGEPGIVFGCQGKNNEETIAPGLVFPSEMEGLHLTSMSSGEEVIWIVLTGCGLAGR